MYYGGHKSTNFFPGLVCLPPPAGDAGVRCIKLWQFMEATDASGGMWTWRLIGSAGGVESTSAPLPSYGVTVTDAIRHGFQPSTDKWVVVAAAGVTRFEPDSKGTEV
jgi:hypothetical protein